MPRRKPQITGGYRLGAFEHFRYAFLFMHLIEKLSLVLRANMNVINIFQNVVPSGLSKDRLGFPWYLGNAREIYVKSIIQHCLEDVASSMYHEVPLRLR